MTETRSRDNIRDATEWAHRFTRGSLSIEAADAARAMRDLCVAQLRDAAARMRLAVGMGTSPSCAMVRAQADLLDIHANEMGRLEPAPSLTGLCEPGA